MIRHLLTLCLALLFLWPIGSALRTRRIDLRGRVFTRRSQPWRYWTVIVVSLLMAGLILTGGFQPLPDRNPH